MPVVKERAHLGYRADIDGLRAVAVMSVVFFHAFPSLLRGGFIGVDLFFVISGFLITRIILQGLSAGSFSFSEFYCRRISRIFPALLLVVGVTLAFGWFVLLPDELNQLGKHALAGAAFISNFVLWSEAGYFDRASEVKPLLHLWSLAIEEQFYILWPFVLWLGWKLRGNLLLILLVVLIVSFGLNIAYVDTDPTATFYAPYTRFWELLIGSLIAYWHVTYSQSELGVARNQSRWAFFSRLAITTNQLHKMRNGVAALGAGLLIYGFVKATKGVSFPGYFALLPVLGAASLIVAGERAFINRHILATKPMVWLGLISFPLYLWHWPILSFGHIFYSGKPPSIYRIGAVALSVLLAWLTVRFIEKPLRFGAAARQLKIAGLMLAMLCLGLTGYAVSQHDFSKSNSYERLLVSREGYEHIIGTNFDWYDGKNNFLFMGNRFGQGVAKLRGSISSADERVAAVVKQFSTAAQAARLVGAPVVLVMGPNKSSVYSEFLPDSVVPSTKRYVAPFLDALSSVDNLAVFDPTPHFATMKNPEMLMYFKTDSHWNSYGAYTALNGLFAKIGLPKLDVEFGLGPEYQGDLIEIAKLENYTASNRDNWQPLGLDKSTITEVGGEHKPRVEIGPFSRVYNSKPVIDKKIWVLGDSFSNDMRPFLNHYFREVRYVGHFDDKLDALPDMLAKEAEKPDLILVVRVERSF